MPEDNEQLEDELKIGARNSRNDAMRLQQIHDYAVENGAMCAQSKKSSFVEDGSNCLKTISKSDDEWRVANYMMLYGGRDLTSFADRRGIRPNPDGSLGEFFSEKTEYESDYTKTGALYVDFEHSIDPDNMGIGQDDILGYVDMKTAKKDKRGLFVERVLNRRNQYVKWLEELHDAGFTFGNSTEAINGKTLRAPNGEILKWELKRDTITFNPMESRMLGENHLQAVKGLSEILPELKSLITPEAVDTDKSDSKVSTPQKEAIMPNEELKALLEENNKTLVSTLEEKAETAATKAVEKFMDGLPEVKARLGNQVQVVTDEADRPFKSIGDNLIAIANYTKKGVQHPRMKALFNMELKAALGANEAVPSQGEFLLEPTITDGLLKPIHESGVFTQDAQKLPVGPNSNSGWINGVDETSRATGSRWGGVRGYHTSEAGSMTSSKPKFRRINWELHKAYVLMYATDELLADAGQLSAIINLSASEELNFMANDDILNGIGGDRPVGVLQSNALITFARVDANKVQHDDIVAMWSRMPARHKANAKWYINTEVQPQLDKLTFTSGATGILSPYIGYRPDGVMTIYGKPVVETEFNAALGTQGDILLGDFTDYLFWEKNAVEAASSIHVQFLTDETAFRFIYRYDGQTARNSATTPYKGTNTLSSFVALTASS